MYNNTSNVDYITICDYNKIPKEKLKIVPQKSYDNTKVYQLYTNDWECNIDTNCSEEFCMYVPSEDKQHDQKNWNFWWYEIDGDGTPYDSSIELSADDFEYIRNLYNEYIKNHQ